MSDSGNSRQRLAVDSALVLASITALLYFFGDVERTFRFKVHGVPWDFVPPLAVQGYVRQGGVMLLLFLPFIGFADLLLTMVRPRWYERFGRVLPQNGRVRAVFLSSYAFLVLFLIVAVVSEQMAKHRDRVFVAQLRLKRNSVITRLPPRLYYVLANDRDVVFADAKNSLPSKLIVISRDEIVSMVLHPLSD